MLLNALAIVATTVGPLLGVLVGGWATHWTQQRGWRRDEQRYLMDSRRQAYGLFLTAVRAYFAYAQSPSVKIAAVKVSDGSDVEIPILDETGVPYKERLDAAHASVRLIAGSTVVVERAHDLSKAVRRAVATRAHYDAGRIPRETYLAVWAAERRFIDTVRAELGLGAVEYDD
ncbi:hypothetical protein ACTMTJ_09510 [Phytohabitans sp. LJ34]|uniref:hypothetical protein n=1 Tax=Phytohabitans sp. LJ34 TaxID=3452217 RepID=UPI003F89F3CC